jgi:dTMP kinase
VRAPVLVAVEGVDGSGKTTLCARLANELRSRGYTPVQLVEPSYSRLGRAVREKLAEPDRVNVDELHELFTKDRQDQVNTKLRPLLDLSRTHPDLALVIIQDRSYFSTAAYQRVNAPIEPTIAEQEAFAPRPEVVVLLDLSVDNAVDRHRDRGRQEYSPNPSVLEQARRAYLRLAQLYAFDVRDAMTPSDILTTTLADRYWPKIEAP